MSDIQRRPWKNLVILLGIIFVPLGVGSMAYTGGVLGTWFMGTCVIALVPTSYLAFRWFRDQFLS
jgi:putative effector of murein hydrolase LrgA (UPF0299 family)